VQRNVAVKVIGTRTSTVECCTPALIACETHVLVSSVPNIHQAASGMVDAGPRFAPANLRAPRSRPGSPKGTSLRLSQSRRPSDLWSTNGLSCRFIPLAVMPFSLSDADLQQLPLVFQRSGYNPSRRVRCVLSSAFNGAIFLWPEQNRCQATSARPGAPEKSALHSRRQTNCGNALNSDPTPKAAVYPRTNALNRQIPSYAPKSSSRAITDSTRPA
jgi:hypothetical protein